MINFCLWVFPCVVIWYSFFTPTLGPYTVKFSAFVLESIYEHHNVEIRKPQDTKNWVIKSQIFKTVNGLKAGQAAKDLKLNKSSSQVALTNLSLFILPFALVMLLMLSTDYSPFKTKQRVMTFSIFMLVILILATIGVGCQLTWLYWKLLYAPGNDLRYVTSESLIAVPWKPTEMDMWHIRTATTAIYLFNCLYMPFRYWQTQMVKA